ncbi:MAG: hypothetical protein WCK24_04380, partial [Actinomycetes bacterium]
AEPGQQPAQLLARVRSFAPKTLQFQAVLGFCSAKRLCFVNKVIIPEVALTRRHSGGIQDSSRLNQQT